MLCCDFDEVHVKDVEDVGLALAYFDLLDKGLQEDFDRYVVVLTEYVGEVVQYELPYVRLFVVFNEQEGQLFVHNRCVAIHLAGKLVQ